jgi:hypothetical protein
MRSWGHPGNRDMAFEFGPRGAAVLRIPPVTRTGFSFASAEPGREEHRASRTVRLRVLAFCAGAIPNKVPKATFTVMVRSTCVRCDGKTRNSLAVPDSEKRC